MAERELIYDRWVTHERAAIESASHYVARHGPDALPALEQDALNGRVSVVRAEAVRDSLTFAFLQTVIAAAPHAFGDELLEFESVRRFLSHKLKRLVLNGIDEDTARYLLRNELLLNWQLVRLDRAGRRLYDVSDGLAERLHHTELRGVPCAMLRLPYDGIIVRVPPSAGISLVGDHGEPIPITELYVVECPPPKHTWIVTAFAPDPTGELRQWTVLDLFAHEKVEDLVRVMHERVRQPLLNDVDFRNPQAKKPVAGIAPPARAGAFEVFVRWAMNVVIYASSSGARTEVWGNKEARQLRDRIQKLPKGNKREELNQRLRMMDPDRRILLGPNLPPLNAAVAGDRAAQTVRVLVTGHWKNQPHGPQGSLRRITWIEPYWRGPDDGAVAAPGRRQLVDR